MPRKKVFGGSFPPKHCCFFRFCTAFRYCFGRCKSFLRPKLLRDKFPNGSRQFLCVSRNEQADVHVGRFAERLELRGKRLNFLNALAGDLQGGVNENVRHIVVCSADAADKAYKCVQALNAVSVGVNKTCLVGNIVSKLKALFDNNNVAVGVLNRFVCKLDELLGFAGAFFAD